MNNKAIQDAYRALANYWQIDLPNVDDECAAYVIGIGCGLGCLFNDNKQAEIEWLMSRTGPGEKSAIYKLSSANRQKILEVVERLHVARNVV